MVGREAVALGQLIPSDTPGTAEVSLLVEDDWQNKGLGTALLARLSVIAAIRGYDTIFALGLPGEDRVIRAARRAGLAAVTSEEGNQQQVTIGTQVRLSALRTDGNALSV